MKKLIYYAVLLSVAFTWAACKKNGNYPGGQISQYIPMYDLRKLYKGTDVTLTSENMYGSDKIAGIVISDYRGSNMPAGLLVLQDHRRLNTYRGIAVNIGADASKYVPGDSITITIAGGVLTRDKGIMQIKNVPTSAITKVTSGLTVTATRIPSSTILKDPSSYESTLVAIVKGGFDPLPTPADVFAGDKQVNDGFDNIFMHTEAGATFANNSLPVSANFYGIIFNTTDTNGALVPQLRLRTAGDIQVLSSTLTITPIVISGFINDVIGGDGNYEYVQFLATQDIDFSVTPYSLVVCNNAGAATPTGFPVNGWASGGGAVTPKAVQFKSYKINITSGTAKKGSYFYVGGTAKRINGSSSTDISSANWVRTLDYTSYDGDDFGTRYSGLMANSGNAWGMAIFAGTNVTKDSTPIDVIFMSTGGSLFTTTPAIAGYKITNTDFYDIVNPITLATQPYFMQGSNTIALAYSPADLGYYYKLGGVYNPRLSRWVKARSQQTVILTKQSALNEIEGEFPAGKDGEEGLMPTTLKN